MPFCGLLRRGSGGSWAPVPAETPPRSEYNLQPCALCCSTTYDRQLRDQPGKLLQLVKHDADNLAAGESALPRWKPWGSICINLANPGHQGISRFAVLSGLGPGPEAGLHWGPHLRMTFMGCSAVALVMYYSPVTQLLLLGLACVECSDCWPTWRACDTFGLMSEWGLSDPFEISLSLCCARNDVFALLCSK